MFGRALITLGLWLVKIGTQTSGRTQYVRVPEADPPPVVRFTLEAPARGWVYQYNTEPEVRAFIAAYYRCGTTQPDLIVTRFVNDREDAQVTVTPSTFDPALPLFPLEASAA